MPGRVLVIAGSDSGAGAGIQADLKTVMALGGFATTAVTAVTVQDTGGVHDVHLVPAAVVAAQVDAVLADIGADAIKTGMLGDALTLAAIVERLEAAGAIPLVVDPVMIAKGGRSLMADEMLDLVRKRLLPLAAVLTPNLPEAEALLGRTIGNPAEAATDLLSTGAAAVLLKGGHGSGDVLTDVLAVPGRVWSFQHPRIDTRHTHGTGCTLASAIATGLAQGLALLEAVERGLDYVQAAIRTAPGLGAGHGPLNHAVTIDVSGPSSHDIAL